MSGNVAVMSFPFLDHRTGSPSARSTMRRYPSYLISKTHPSFVKGSSRAVANITWKPLSLPVIDLRVAEPAPPTDGDEPPGWEDPAAAPSSRAMATISASRSCGWASWSTRSPE